MFEKDFVVAELNEAIKFTYVRDKQKRPIGLILCLKKGDSVGFGISMCHPFDAPCAKVSIFKREDGKRVYISKSFVYAYNYAKSSIKSERVQVPVSVKRKYIEFVETRSKFLKMDLTPFTKLEYNKKKNNYFSSVKYV